eukprot:scaffold9140_cov207-Isochrysis_galbana.AAC.2
MQGRKLVHCSIHTPAGLNPRDIRASAGLTPTRTSGQVARAEQAPQASHAKTVRRWTDKRVNNGVAGRVLTHLLVETPATDRPYGRGGMPDPVRGGTFFNFKKMLKR